MEKRPPSSIPRRGCAWEITGNQVGRREVRCNRVGAAYGGRRVAALLSALMMGAIHCSVVSFPGNAPSFSIDDQRPPFPCRSAKIDSKTLEIARDFRGQWPVLLAIRAPIATRMDGSPSAGRAVRHHKIRFDRPWLDDQRRHRNDGVAARCLPRRLELELLGVPALLPCRT
jgi:hypothetical protein